MKQRLVAPGFFLIVALLAAQFLPRPSLAQTGGTTNGTFADPLFKSIWERTDSLVASGRVQRSWYWGPGPGDVKSEPYSGNRAGVRTVQYFDKARMEINNPDGDRSSPWFVTTGLLVSEMVAGKQQVGDAEHRVVGPAEIAVGGDGLDADPDAPTYTSFRPVASLGGPGANRAPNRVGQAVTATLSRAGLVGDNLSVGFYPGATISAYSEELGHNIPQAMWDFLNLRGPVQSEGVVRDGERIADWVFVMGYPITEPYWARVKIDGVYADVLFQLYQRRSLAYIPSLPPGWQVQMGNVGAHYYRWLYGGPLPSPQVPLSPVPTTTTTAVVTATGTPATPIATQSPPTATATTSPSVVPTFTPQPSGTPNASPTVPIVPTEPPGGLIVAVRPPYGPPDAQFLFEATGLAANEEVQVIFTDPNGMVVYPSGSNGGRYQADIGGALRFSLVPVQAFPAAPLGYWQFEVRGLQSRLEGVVGFTLR